MKSSGTPSPRGQHRLVGALPVLLLILSLACSFPFGGSLPTPTPNPQALAPAPKSVPDAILPPDLVESDPPTGLEIAAGTPITLFFNQPMDRSSVEKALSTAGEADLTWEDDSTLRLVFKNPPPPGEELLVRVGQEARSQRGSPLEQPLQLNYQMAGFLKLAQRLPEPGSVEIDPTSAIVAAFNRPVVPLGAEDAGQPPAFRLDPPAEGRGLWLNTSTYVFYPQPALQGGREYTVLLNEEVRSAAGTPLETIENWTFSTAAPRLESFSPASTDLARLDEKIILSFNQPMDPDSLAANLSITGPRGPLAGETQWDEDWTTLTITPTQALDYGARYTLTIGAQARSAGGTPLGQAVEHAFSTYPALQVTGSDPGAGGLASPYAGVGIRFSTPINDTDLLPYLSVEPPVTNLSYWWNEFDRELRVSGDYAANRSYILRLLPGLPDAWNGRLEQEFALQFTTQPLDPDISRLDPYSPVVYLTSQDSYLTLQATNLFSVPVTTGRLGLEDFFARMGPTPYQPGPPVAIRSWQQNLNTLSNQSQLANLYLTPEQGTLAPGLYQIDLGLPETLNWFSPLLVAVSDIHLTFKLGSGEVFVWAVDLRTDRPVANAPVAVYAGDGSLLAEGQTGADGVFRAQAPPLDDPYALVYAVLGAPGDDFFGIALSQWNYGLNGWDFGYLTDVRGPHLMLYLYSDRPIYRPGQTLYFRLVARQADYGRYTLPDLDRLPLSLQNEAGEEVASFDLPLSTFGTAHGEYVLPETLPTGEYRLVSSAADDAGLSFRVSEYRKPEIDLQVEFGVDQAQAGDRLPVAVYASYYFGAPAGNLPLSWTLSASPNPFSLPEYEVGAYDTGWLDLMILSPLTNDYTVTIAQGEAQTAPDGTLILELDSLTEDWTLAEMGTQRMRYHLEVVAEDESGLPVAARADTLVHPAQVYLGARPETWSGRAGEVAYFNVQAAQWDQSPAGELALRAEFGKVEWVRTEGPTVFRGPSYTERFTPLASTDFTTSSQGQARLAFTPPEPGTYRLALSGLQEPAAGAATEILWWAGGPGQAVWPSLPNSRLRLTPDRENYRVGDTAQIFVPNPFTTSTTALVSVERGQVLRYQSLILEPGGVTVPLRIQESDSPNIYVAVTLLGRTEDGRPDFRQGYLNLNVDTEPLELDVRLSARPERTGPGETVEFDLFVTDSAGQPVEGEFSLSLVDKAVLALADPNAEDILPAFYGTQPLGVRTSLSLAAYGNRRVALPGGMGGGGGDFLSGIVVRRDFPDTAYWNPNLTTGPDGRSSLSLTLPDNLTTWMVDLRGLTADARVGQAETEIVVTRDLLVRPVTPRFLVSGDHVRLAAVVQNNTPDGRQVEVSLQANGFTLDQPSTTTQSVSLAPGGQARVEWWGTVQDVPRAELIFVARSGDLSDAATPSPGALPILRYAARQSFRTSGVLDEGGEILELVSLPRSFTGTGAGLQVELAPSLGAAMLDALAALERQPYDLTEQILSGFLPNLEAHRLLQSFGITNPELEARLGRTVDAGLQRLLDRQNEDGGWSWWTAGESDSYVTAYILFGLVRLRQAGLAVPGDALQRAVAYLQAGLPAPETAREIDLLAFEHWSLAEAGAGDRAAMEALYARRNELSPWAQAALALGLETADPGSQAAQTLLSGLGSSAMRPAAEQSAVFWDAEGAPRSSMVDPVTSTALVVYALARRDPGSPLLADAVRYLMASRQADGAWSSSYSTAWTVMALVEFMRGTGELGGDFTFSASLNGSVLAQGRAAGIGQLNPVTAIAPLTSLHAAYPNALVIQREPGPGRLYYNITLDVNRPVETAGPLANGVSISRQYFPPGECLAGTCEAIRSAQAGSLVNVRLSLTLPEDTYHLVVEDYLPAGTEILDTRLKTSQAVLPDESETQPEPVYDPQHPFSAGWGWWLFSEPQIYDERIAWLAEYLPAGTYELTYTLIALQPGEYRVLPAHAREFYFPEIQGNSAGEIFTVLP